MKGRLEDTLRDLIDREGEDQVRAVLDKLTQRDPECRAGRHDYKEVDCVQSNQKFVCQRPNCGKYYWD